VNSLSNTNASFSPKFWWLVSDIDLVFECHVQLQVQHWRRNRTCDPFVLQIVLFLNPVHFSNMIKINPKWTFWKLNFTRSHSILYFLNTLFIVMISRHVAFKLWLHIPSGFKCDRLFCALSKIAAIQCQSYISCCASKLSMLLCSLLAFLLSPPSDEVLGKRIK